MVRLIKAAHADLVSYGNKNLAESATQPEVDCFRAVKERMAQAFNDTPVDEVI